MVMAMGYKGRIDKESWRRLHQQGNDGNNNSICRALIVVRGVHPSLRRPDNSDGDGGGVIVVEWWSGGGEKTTANLAAALSATRKTTSTMTMTKTLREGDSTEAPIVGEGVCPSSRRLVNTNGDGGGGEGRHRPRSGVFCHKDNSTTMAMVAMTTAKLMGTTTTFREGANIMSPNAFRLQCCWQHCIGDCVMVGWVNAEHQGVMILQSTTKRLRMMALDES